MKILRKYLEKNSSGYVKLICEEDEDMWHIFNLVRVGDTVRASTLRKIAQESATGSKINSRIKLTLTIVVETVNFDPTVCSLHLKGRNTEENEHVKMGAYHTLDLELNRPFTLKKNYWDVIDLDRLDLCADITRTADVAAVVLHEGLANVCLISASMTIVKAKIEMQISRKRKGFTNQHEKSLQHFLQNVCAAFARHVNLDLMKCVLIASPGFVKDQLMDALMQYADKEGIKSWPTQKSKFVLVHSSSGFKHSLKEVLADPAVSHRLSETKVQAEVKALDQFLELMAMKPDWAVYGYAHVKFAKEQEAIETLMLSDSLFRSKNVAERRKYVKLVEVVRKQGATVLIFSSMHVSGEQLTQLTGIAAILRFPIPNIDDHVEGWALEKDQQESDERILEDPLNSSTKPQQSCSSAHDKRN